MRYSEACRAGWDHPWLGTLLNCMAVHKAWREIYTPALKYCQRDLYLPEGITRDTLIVPLKETGSDRQVLYNQLKKKDLTRLYLACEPDWIALVTGRFIHAVL